MWWMNGTPETYTPPAKPAPSGWGKLFAGLALGVVAFLVLLGLELVGSWLIATQGADLNTVLAACELITGILALGLVVALGGKRIARPRLHGMGEAWRAALWLFIANGIFVFAEVAEIALGIEPLALADDWPTRLLVLALVCIGVGLTEESILRGLCLNGLLARMGRSRAGVYGAVIISSLIFGAVHLDPLIDFGDPLLVAQDVMKGLQSGMCGFLFAAIMVKTRNLWAVASIHAANDFFLLFIANGLTAAPVSTEYVQAGDTGAVILALYTVLCVLYLPFLFIGKRLIDQASPWRGDFYHYDEPEPADPPSPPSDERDEWARIDSKIQSAKHARISTPLDSTERTPQ